MQCAEQEGGRRMRRFFLKKIAVLAVLLAAVLAAFPAFAEVDIPLRRIFTFTTAQMSFRKQQKVIL